MRHAIFSISGALGVHRLFASLHRNQPIVLTFHGVTASPPSNICNYEGIHLNLPVFARLMAHLASRYRVVRLAQVIDWLDGKGAPPERSVAITFDDGFRNVLTTAAPVLRRFGIPATLYVATDFVFHRRMLWPDRLLSALALTREPALRVELGNELRTFGLGTDADRIAANEHLRSACKSLSQKERLALLERVIDQLGVDESRLAVAWDDQRPLAPDELALLPDAGIDVGSHTCTHPIVSRLAPPEAAHELAESKRLIEAATGQPCVDFAYPNGGPGDFSADTHRSVGAAGYRSAVTTIKRRVSRADSSFEIPRCTLTRNDITVAEFAAEVSGFPGALRAVKRRVAG